MTAIDDLVETLASRTASGQIEWKQADAKGRSFIATQEAGTVLIEGPAVEGFQSSPGYRLVVKDSQGLTLEEVVAKGGGALGISLSTAFAGLDPPAVRALPGLYFAVKESVLAAEQKLRTLTKQFGG